MSEYQYYEFLKLNKPLTPNERKIMDSLSSRAKITTHGASYVYNYGDFRSNPKELLLKYFDIFFYIANWGSISLMFKYHEKQVCIDELKKYCVKDVISCRKHGNNILLNIELNNEGGFGWIEGEGILPDLLPLYDEFKAGDYQLLNLIAEACHTNNQDKSNYSDRALTDAQEAFLKYAEFGDLVD